MTRRDWAEWLAYLAGTVAILTATLLLVGLPG